MQSNGFTKGIIVGSLIGASVTMMMNPDMMSKKHKRRLMRSGRNIARRSGDIFLDVIEHFR